MKVTDNYSGISGRRKYDAICVLLNLEKFPTGDLNGAGSKELVWHNGFYPQPIDGILAIDGAQMRFRLTVDLDWLEFDPMREAVERIALGRPKPFVCGSVARIEIKIRNPYSEIAEIKFVGGKHAVPQKFIVQPGYSGTICYPEFEMFGVVRGEFRSPFLRFSSNLILQLDLKIHYRLFKGGTTSLDDALDYEFEMSQF